MELIDPIVEVEKYDGIKIMKNIERAMRNCYRTEGSITDDSYKRLLAKSINSGHGSVMEHEKITIRFTADIGCYDDETEVLTTNGWKFFKDLTVNDKVFTLDDSNKIVESPIRALISKDYNGEMYHFSNTTLDLMVTPDHNMWVFDEHKRSTKTKIWKFLEAKDMTNNIYKFNKIGNKQRTDIQRNIKVPNKQFLNNTNKYGREFNNELLYELLGWFITDGSLNYKGNNVSLRLHQIKEKGVLRIKQILDALRISYTYSSSGTFYINYSPLAYFFKDLCYKDKNNNKKSINSFIPDFVRYSATNEIEAFLKGVYGGDGSIYKDGRKIIYTASEQFAKDLIELFFRIGKTASYYPCPDMSKYEKSFNQTTTCYCVSEFRTEISYWCKNKTHYGEKNFEKISYNGKVYCLTLDKFHRIFVMRNGKTAWCGQCYKDLTRHRTGTAFSIESTRYCSYNKDKFDNNIKFIKPVFYKDSWTETKSKGSTFDDDEYRSAIWFRTMEDIEDNYMQMSKIPDTTPDMMRMLLPHSTAAQVVMTCNIREWRHIFSLRCAKAAHPSIRQILIPLLLKFKEDMPELFGDIEYDTDFPPEKYAKVIDLEDTI